MVVTVETKIIFRDPLLGVNDKDNEIIKICNHISIITRNKRDLGNDCETARDIFIFCGVCYKIFHLILWVN
jgi:hypothetical protein